MAKTRRIWIYSPARAPKPKVPDSIKKDLEAKARELVERVLKPAHVRPPADERFNYIVNIYTKCYRNCFYFCAKYRSPGPNALSPYFDMRFARLEYVGNSCFSLSYMRHTGQWWETHRQLSINECLVAIKDEPHFWP